MGNEFCIVIPARLKSTRLEQKLLRQVKGKPLIQWTWENSIKSNAKKVIVVTDSKEIVDIISSLGGNVFLSKENIQVVQIESMNLSLVKDLMMRT